MSEGQEGGEGREVVVGGGHECKEEKDEGEVENN